MIPEENLSRRERRPYIKTAQLYDCQVEAMFFDTPLDICKERNRSRTRVSRYLRSNIIAQTKLAAAQRK